MKYWAQLTGTGLFALTMACGPSTPPATETKEEAPAAMLTAKAELKSSKGEDVGQATFTQTNGSVRLSVEVKNMPPGTHAIHVHGVGQCDAPDFKTAGGHFNPGAKQHGFENPQGHHVGDMPNMTVGQDGTGTFEYTIEGASLAATGENSLFHPGGTALVVHADPDDMKTDPAGNAGGRIACGVVTR